MVVGVSDRGVLNQPVNLFCVLPISDGDAKRHKVYTGSGNVPYIQSGSVGDSIPEPRCSKSIVGVQMRRRKKGVYKRFGWLRLEGLRSKLGGPAVVRC